jgi:hypothetical protein
MRRKRRTFIAIEFNETRYADPRGVGIPGSGEIARRSC